MIQCPICQTLNKEPSRFCLECGTSLSAGEAKESLKNSPDSPKVNSPRLRSPLLSGDITEEPPEGLASKSGNKRSAKLTPSRPLKMPASINNTIPAKDSLIPGDLSSKTSDFTTIKSNVMPSKLRSPLLSGNEPNFSSTFTRIPLPSSFSPESKKPGQRLHSPLLDSLPSQSPFQFESEVFTDDPYADEDNPNILRSPLLSEKIPLDNTLNLKAKQTLPANPLDHQVSHQSLPKQNFQSNPVTNAFEQKTLSVPGSSTWSSPLDNKPSWTPPESPSSNSKTNSSSILASLGVTIPAASTQASSTVSPLDYLITDQVNIAQEQATIPLDSTSDVINATSSDNPHLNAALTPPMTLSTSPAPGLSDTFFTKQEVISDKSHSEESSHQLSQIKETSFFNESTPNRFDRPNPLVSSQLTNSPPEIKPLKTRPLSRSSFASAGVARNVANTGTKNPVTSTSHSNVWNAGQAAGASDTTIKQASNTLPSRISSPSLLLKICGILVLCMACSKLITILQFISLYGFKSPSFIFDEATTLIAFSAIGIGFLLSRK